MGTRALITKDGKPFIATHWDGNPASLGAELVNATSDKDIVAIARRHVIDFADRSLINTLNKERFAHIAKLTKGKYSAKDIAELHKRGRQIIFGVMSSEENPVSDIKNYGDWAEYQYDFSGGSWKFRPLSGSYPESFGDGAGLKPLNRESIEKS